MELEFQMFPKMARFSREIVITEKIDGTNAQVLITEDGKIFVGSRTRWITPENDNFGFAKWIREHQEEVLKLGVGRHFGEWWGSSIQREYNLPKGEKRFSLFNVTRWCLHDEEPKIISSDNSPEVKYQDRLPELFHLVPELYRGEFDTDMVNNTLEMLVRNGSQASLGFMNPEGIVVFHTAGQIGFKKTIKNDELPKSLVK